MNRSKLKIAIALVAMFLLGAVAGAGLNTFLRPYFYSPPHPEDLSLHMMKFWTQRLNLTPDQQEQAKPIAADYAQQVKVLHEQSINQFSQLAEATENRLSQFLTDIQKAELIKMRKEWHKGFGHRSHGPGLPPDHPSENSGSR